MWVVSELKKMYEQKKKHDHTVRVCFARVFEHMYGNYTAIAYISEWEHNTIFHFHCFAVRETIDTLPTSIEL